MSSPTDIPANTHVAALAEVQRLYATGANDAARSFCAELQRKAPHDPAIRAVMRQIVQSTEEFDRDGYIEELLETLAADEPLMVERAALGWHYVATIDRRYLIPGLTKALVQLRRAEPPAEPMDVGPLDNVFERLKQFDSHVGRYAFLEALALADDPLLRMDDYADIADKQLGEALKGSFDQEKLNIVIVGAGCVGLALANTLQTGLGHHARILVVENRVERRHRKLPYSRVWLTHINMPELESILAEEVVQALAHSGADGFMGASLDIYETLLLLSCRQRGVKFLFDGEPDYGFLNGAGVDLVFDATGGRFQLPPDAEPAHAPAPLPPVTVDARPAYGGQFADFGVTDRTDFPAVEFALEPDGQRMVPHLNGEPVRSALFKIIDVPFELHDELVRFVSAENEDSTFYIWPGHLTAELNKLLVLINLDQAGYEGLAARVTGKMPLAEFAAAGAVSGLDSRVTALIDRLVALEQSRDGGVPMQIEPPFLYTPYLCRQTLPLAQIHGVPVVPVGDSLFNGHPKVGNGLLTHLRHLRNIHDLMLSLF